MPLKYYISRMNPSLSKLFDERGYEQCKQKKDADFVIIPGGADILPTLYGAYIHPSTNYVIEQDLADMAAWRYFGTNVPYIGVCRGAQFINAVMAGGSLYQHVTGHKTTHQIYFTRSGYSKKVSDLMNFTVSSTHHQMMIPAPDAHIYGWTHLADHLEQYNRRNPIKRTLTDRYDDGVYDPEIVLYDRKDGLLGLCVQGHPEYNPKDNDTFRDVFFELVEEVVS